jgi:hypothetical protein
VELHAGALSQAAAQFGKDLSELPGWKCTDFFELQPAGLLADASMPRCEAVVGNPPYVRYQAFSGKARERALAAAASAGIRLTELSSSWAPYLIHAASFLAPRGRLAMVLPAELLHVQYAREIRRWLAETFSSVVVIAFDRRVFPSVLEDTILLLAETDGRASGVRILRMHDAKDLHSLARKLKSASPIERVAGKWSSYLLDSDAQRLLGQLADAPGVKRMGDVAKVDIGIVTGENDFFLLSEPERAEWGIPSPYLQPVVSRAQALRGLVFGKADWQRIASAGHKCFLLAIPKPIGRSEAPSLQRYLAHGVERGVTDRYKTKIRDHWYCVPVPPPPDAFLTYMSYNTPRVLINRAKCVSSNTIHNLRFLPRIRRLLFAVGFYNTLTLLSCELEGRSYGGGVLKLEPTEAEGVLILSPQAKRWAERLRRLAPLGHRLLRAGLTPHFIEKVDEILLAGDLGLSERDLKTLRDAFVSIRTRRFEKATKTSHAKTQTTHTRPAGTSQ